MFKKIALLAVFTLIFSVSRAFATPLPVYEGGINTFIAAFNKMAAKTGCFKLDTKFESSEDPEEYMYILNLSPKKEETAAIIFSDKKNNFTNIVFSSLDRNDIDKALKNSLRIAGSTDAEINEVEFSYGTEPNVVGVACAAKKRCFYVTTVYLKDDGSYSFSIKADSDFPVG